MKIPSIINHGKAGGCLNGLQIPANVESQQAAALLELQSQDK
jgi:hypothetical protein